MARISYVNKDQASDEVKEIYSQIEQGFGTLPNFFKAMAQSPEALKMVWGIFSQVVPSWKLSPKLLELAYIRASQLNDCDY
jgi:alkylhydroperoxidase family enzyme